jgi:hypothetical protein
LEEQAELDPEDVQSRTVCVAQEEREEQEQEQELEQELEQGRELQG